MSLLRISPRFLSLIPRLESRANGGNGQSKSLLQSVNTRPVLLAGYAERGGRKDRPWETPRRAAVAPLGAIKRQRSRRARAARSAPLPSLAPSSPAQPLATRAHSRSAARHEPRSTWQAADRRRVGRARKSAACLRGAGHLT